MVLPGHQQAEINNEEFQSGSSPIGYSASMVSGYNARENARIRLLNRVFWLILPLQGGVFLFNLIFFQHLIGTIFIGATLVLYSAAYLLSRQGYYLASRVMATVPIILCLNYFTCLFGRTAGGSISFLLIGSAVMILYENKIVRAAHLALLILSFFFTEWYIYQFGPAFVTTTTGFMPIIVFTACMLVMIAMMLHYEEELNRYYRETGNLLGTLRNKNRVLTQANYELAHFAHTASHHFKGPLKNISSLLGLIERRLSEAKNFKLRRFIELVKNDARHLYELIEDILFYSSVDEEAEPDSGWTRPEELMLRVKKNLGAVMEDRSAVLTWSGGHQFSMNPHHAELLLQNLIENGIKYNQSEVPTVHVRFSTNDQGFSISVEDNGIGIAPEYRASIFNMFSRLHTREEYEGTGIGLSVCQKIVHLYGGAIKLTDAVSGGSVFTASFPASKETAIGNMPGNNIESREGKSSPEENTSRALAASSSIRDRVHGIWERAQQIGVGYVNSDRENAILRLFNRLNGLIAFAMLLIMIYDIITWDIVGFGISASIFLCCFMSFVFIAKGYFRQVRWTSILFVTCCMSVLIMCFGQDTGGELTLLAMALSCIVLFESWKERRVFLGFIFVAYGVSQVYLLNFGTILEYGQVQLIYFITFGTNLFVMIFLMSFFISQLSRHEREIGTLLSGVNKKNRDLEQANFELSQFAFAASHHLKSPLKNISSLLGLIERKLDDKDQKNIQYLDMVKNDALHLYQMVEDILTYSRLDVSHRSRQISEQELKRVIRRIESNLEELIKAKGAEIVIESLCDIRASEYQIELMLQILIENGLTYNHSDPPRIIVSAETSDQKEVILKVCDNGIGIPEEYHQKIFEMFSRLHPQGEYSGTGIGLTICNRIMISYNGAVSVDSKPGTGTTFSLHFPHRSQQAGLEDEADQVNLLEPLRV